MRNLKLQYCKTASIQVKNARHFLPFDCYVRNDETIFTVTGSKIYSCRNDDEPKEFAEVPEIVGAEYVTLNSELCVATAGGEVLLFDIATQKEHEGTFCDVGIECMCWSPDQGVVVFVTKKLNVVVMTSTFDVVTEHTLVDSYNGDGQFVNVGWGKKETQFHGTAGKTAAKEKSDFQAPENVEDLPKNIEVNWRGDSAFFVVSFVQESVGRMFKVFNKEGRHMFTSEKVNGLQPPIAWRPTGTWIAVPQVLPNKSTIALFEKNGLRHREIVLPFDLAEEPIMKLSWSSDSDILSVQTELKDEQRLYLYTVCNYHWYIKQVLVYPKTDPIALHQWDTRIGEERTLFVLLVSGKLMNYKWHFGFDRFGRSGAVAVIDGKKLLFTDFSKSVVPPPMCNKELQLESYINACTFLLDELGLVQLCIYTSKREMQFCCAPLQAPIFFKRHTVLTADEDIIKYQLCHIHYFTSAYLVATETDAFNTRLILLAMNPTNNTYKMESSMTIKGTVNALTIGSPALDEFYVQSIINSNVYQVSVKLNNTLRVERSIVQLPLPADFIEWFMVKEPSTDGLITLRTNQELHVDGKLIAENVTSYCLAGNLLAFTKLTTLNFLRLKDKHIVDERKIERGGKLVTITGNARTVLQMPRGNLETINPRVLALEIVGEMLQLKHYRRAFDILRKQRINLNIICDHDMKEFTSSINTFLNQIKDASWLSLFLTDLQNEDFTQTMYASNYDGSVLNYPEDYSPANKVNYISKLMIDRMISERNPRFDFPIITAYVKVGKHEQALQLIWEQKKNSETTNKAEKLMKHLLYIVDVNELYNVALGTYDFSLVLYVAEKTQKDPKEFLPFLNELKSYETNYRMFKIDEHLKRYEKALQHITNCGVEHHEEALKFIIKHNFYRQALSCFETQPDFHKQICVAFGDDLRANGKLENASIMYERGGQYQQAMMSAKHILDWRRTVALAQKDKQDVASVALSLAGPLQEHGRHQEAYLLMKTYGDDYNEALRALLKSRNYLKAIFEVRTCVKKEELLDTIVREDLIAYANSLESSLITDKENFNDYKSRLLKIRQSKSLPISSDDKDEIDEADLLSDTTSLHSSRYTGSSRGTGKTFRSSKNRRKHERKLLSLKPGNPFEDIALIDALHNLVTKIADQQQHMHDICKALLELQLDTLAKQLQQEFGQLLDIVQAALDEIWVPELTTNVGLTQLSSPDLDYTTLKNEQRYQLIKPLKRIKPQMLIYDWKHAILS